MIPENQPVIQENIPFGSLGSYKLGGVVRYFATPQSEQALQDILLVAREKAWPIFILGGGTNLLVSDKGFDGLMIRPAISFIEKDGDSIRVGAGVSVADLLRFVIDYDLGGLEWAGGLPGSVGGGVRGNAGCFGGEMKDGIKSVESVDVLTGERKIRNREECEFSYRSSIFKEKLSNKEIITAATFSFLSKEGALIKEIVDDHIRYRTERQPLEYPNIGSIFKNVDAREMSEESLVRFVHVIKQDPFPVIPTAYLISEAGLKGVVSGGAQISLKHPNFIVNLGGAKASDVVYLIELAQREVKKKFDIAIEPEVIRI